MDDRAGAGQTQPIAKGGTMPKAATIQAKQECRKVPRGQQMTVGGITFVPLGRDQFRVIAPVGCQIEVERVEPINVEFPATSHPSNRQES